MKIVTLCGCGLGTCFILKFTAEQALNKLGITAEVIPCGIENGSVEKADLYLVPYGLEYSLGVDSSSKVAAIRNVLSVQEVGDAIKCLLGRGETEIEKWE